jgi:hypothetical protein
MQQPDFGAPKHAFPTLDALHSAGMVNGGLHGERCVAW